MSAKSVTDKVPPYRLELPASQKVPLIFSSPHSGRNYPSVLLEQTNLKLRKLRSLEDCYVDDLFDHVGNDGAPFIEAELPRAFLDLNREPYELDPKLIEPRLPSYTNPTSLRVKSGLGTIPRIVADGSTIYQAPIMLPDALARINQYHQPYHDKLVELTKATQKEFGFAILLDCHSMPSSTNLYQNQISADIILGNRHGTSCAPHITESVLQAFKSLGFTVKLNKPYAGGFITEHHGNPETAIHAIQIEINRALYMDQITLEKTAGFDDLKSKLKSLTAILADKFGSADDVPLAAE